jgi:hypothetical protein
VFNTEKAVAEGKKKILKFSNLIQSFSGNLAQAKGRLAYLKTLSQSQDFGGSNSLNQKLENCPICTEPMGVQVVVLACGHRYCEECMLAVIGKNRGHTIYCPTCRSGMKLGIEKFKLKQIES